MNTIRKLASAYAITSILCLSSFANAAEAPSTTTVELPPKQPSQLEQDMDAEAETMAAGGPYYAPPQKTETGDTPAPSPQSPTPSTQPPAQTIESPTPPAPSPSQAAPTPAPTEPSPAQNPAPMPPTVSIVTSEPLDAPTPEPPATPVAPGSSSTPAPGAATEIFPLPEAEAPAPGTIKRVRLVDGDTEEWKIENAGKQWRDVAYGMNSSKQSMDIYLPDTGKGPFPVIVALHGRGGDKQSKEASGQIMGLSHGYAVVCVNYREAAEARFPADVMDVKAAIRFLKGNASKYHLDASRIAAWGDSFGGKLAAFLGTTSGHPELEDLSIGSRGQSSRVTAVVAWFPALDEVHMDEDFRQLGIRPALPRNAESYGMEVYGVPIQTIPNLVAFHDPTRYIASDASPTLIMHGTADDVCPITQSERFYNQLKHTIGSKNVEYVKVKGAGHHVADFLTKDNLKKVFQFLDKRMKSKKIKKE